MSDQDEAAQQQMFQVAAGATVTGNNVALMSKLGSAEAVTVDTPRGARNLRGARTGRERRVPGRGTEELGHHRGGGVTAILQDSNISSARKIMINAPSSNTWTNITEMMQALLPSPCQIDMPAFLGLMLGGGTSLAKADLSKLIMRAVKKPGNTLTHEGWQLFHDTCSMVGSVMSNDFVSRVPRMAAEMRAELVTVISLEEQQLM